MSASLSKEQIRQQHPLYGQERIEVAHIQDRFLGGTCDPENLRPLTLPEHLVDHVIKAEQAEDWEIARRHYGASRLIACRMTPEENMKANALMVEHRKTR